MRDTVAPTSCQAAKSSCPTHDSHTSRKRLGTGVEIRLFQSTLNAIHAILSAISPQSARTSIMSHRQSELSNEHKSSNCEHRSSVRYRIACFPNSTNFNLAGRSGSEKPGGKAFGLTFANTRAKNRSPPALRMPLVWKSLT